MALRARLLGVAELPTWRYWENVEEGSSPTPPLRGDHVMESFAPGAR
jgi:hypothetical protein